MTETLGVHIDEHEITAARYDAARGDSAVAVALAEPGPATAAVVARDEGGAVLVGDAARDADGPKVTDPLARAAQGRRGALVAVLNHAVGRATAAAGEAPQRLAVVVPDDFDATARDHVVAAGVAAGVADTVVVPIGAASTQPAGVDPVVALAAGAARAAALASSPLVTREDLGDAAPPPAAAPPAPAPPASPVSIFDSESPEPPRPVPSAGPSAAAASEPTSVTPRAAPARVSPGPPVPPVAEPLRYEPPARRIPMAAWIAAVLIGLIAAVGGGIVWLSGGDEGAVATDATTTTVATTEAPATSSTTTEVPTTTDPDATTSSTTSSTTTSSTTTTSTTSTTSVPVPVGVPGVVTLVETGLQFDDATVVRFGQPVEVVIDEVDQVLGSPDDDSDWEVNEFCAGSRTRVVEWGDLELVFTEEDLDSEEGEFTQWYAAGSDDPEGLVTRDGLGVGATVGFLEVTYGPALAIVQAIEAEELGLFAVTNPGSGGILNGITTSLDPEGTVTDLWAGDSCPRVFT